MRFFAETSIFIVMTPRRLPIYHKISIFTTFIKVAFHRKPSGLHHFLGLKYQNIDQIPLPGGPFSPQNDFPWDETLLKFSKKHFYGQTMPKMAFSLRPISDASGSCGARTEFPRSLHSPTPLVPRPVLAKGQPQVLIMRRVELWFGPFQNTLLHSLLGTMLNWKFI